MAEFNFLLEHRTGIKHSNADSLTVHNVDALNTEMAASTLAELELSNPQVTTISLALRVFTVDLRHMQPTLGSPVALASDSLLKGVPLGPMLVETNGLKLKKLLYLLLYTEVSGGLLKDT